MLAAANRDPIAFKNPDTVDLHRRPNPHVTFGYGPHLCLGAPLARLEARIALPRLHARYPAMRLAGEPLVWVDGLGLRGLEALPVHLGSRH
jgi:cytochrome P450